MITGDFWEQVEVVVEVVGVVELELEVVVVMVSKKGLNKSELLVNKDLKVELTQKE